jgi:broad specificity phosphatase PhoE
MTGTTIWLARHGAADNPRNVLYGRLPRVRLTDQGRREARALADFLAPRKLAAIYSSPMLRARRTAEAVLAEQHTVKRIHLDSDIQEIRTGWQGEPIEALQRINWDFYSNPRSPADESLSMVHDRMRRWVGRMLRRHAGAEVLGVSHGDPILILAASLRGLPLERERIFPQPYGIPTGGVFRFRFSARGECQEVRLVTPVVEAAA